MTLLQFTLDSVEVMGVEVILAVGLYDIVARTALLEGRGILLVVVDRWAIHAIRLREALEFSRVKRIAGGDLVGTSNKYSSNA